MNTENQPRSSLKDYKLGIWLLSFAENLLYMFDIQELYH